LLQLLEQTWYMSLWCYCYSCWWCCTYFIYRTSYHVAAPANSTTMCGMIRALIWYKASTISPPSLLLSPSSLCCHSNEASSIIISCQSSRSALSQVKRVNLHENENENENDFSLLLLRRCLSVFLWHNSSSDWGSGTISLRPPASCREFRFVWDTRIIYSKLSNCFAYHKKDFLCLASLRIIICSWWLSVW